MVNTQHNVEYQRLRSVEWETGTKKKERKRQMGMGQRCTRYSIALLTT